MVDIPKLYTDVKNNLAGTGAKVELVNVGGDVKINVGEALRNYNSGAPQKTDTETGDKEIVSKQKATYKNKEGVLIHYANGTVEFKISKKQGSLLTQTILSFKNEDDFKKEKPEKAVSGTIKQSSKEGATFVKSAETTYKYHLNGKVSHSETRNAKGEVLNTVDYNKKGKPEKKIVYDKEGQLQTTYKYTYKGDDTQLIEKYDKDNKLVVSETAKYNGDKRVSAESRYPDGKIAGEATYDENGKLKTKKGYYKNGQLKADTVYYDNGIIKTQTLYDEQGKVTKTITDEIDGKFDSSAQKLQGDCYLLSSINAIRDMGGGQELLSNLVKVSTNEKGEKVYTVTFPGAKLAAKGLQSDNRIKPGTCAITGTYTFTESEMQEILKQAGQNYSIGDGDVILLEAAFEKYREEVNQTLKANGIDPKKVSAEESGLYTGMNENNILAGGQAEDAIFILTGKQSQVFKDLKTKVGLSLADLQAGKATIVELPQVQGQKQGAVQAKAATAVEGEIITQRTELDNMLDKIMKDSEDGHIDNPATVAFRTVDEGGNVGGHALTIKAVTADEVVLVNPWRPDEEMHMSRDDFKKSAYRITITDMSKNNNSSNTPQIPPTLLNAINEYIQQQNQNGGNNNGGNTTPEVSNQNNTVHTPAVHGKYKIPKNITYTNMIKKMLQEQGIEPTKENIAKAKEQFETLNPNSVKTYNGKRKEWHGNKYVLYSEVVNVPKFDMG